MSLKLGNQDVTRVMLGGQEVSAVYKGADELWSLGGSAGGYVDDVFSTYVYKGNGTAQTIENGIDLDGEGGLVWIKNRENSKSHALFDTERGPHNQLYSNTNSQAYDTPGIGVSSFNSDGFTLVGAGTETNSPNDYVSWTFRKAPKFFDVVTYTGDKVQGREIPHSLGCVPGMIIIKSTSSSGGNWSVYSRGSNGGVQPEGYNLVLNTSDPQVDSNAFWADTAPTATHFTIGGANALNNPGEEHIAYLFAHDDSDESIIKCGPANYVGGYVEVNLGWEPQFILLKSVDGPAVDGDWWIYDTVRGISKDVTQPSPRLAANLPNKESSPGYQIELTDNGFKWGGSPNNQKYTYMAIKADPNFRMPPEWEQMNQEVAEKIARRDAAKEAFADKVKNSKDIKDDS